MQETNRTKRVLWAFDTFANDFAIQAKMAKLLRAWSKLNHETIEPVYLMNPTQLRVPPDYFSPHSSEMRLSLSKKIKRQLERFDIPEMSDPLLLTSRNSSLRRVARDLLIYARASNVSLLAITSRSRKGLNRLILGSFAETLVAQSDVPLLIVTPKARVVEKIQNILFPTDLSKASLVGFRRVVAMAQQHGAKITLFHESEFLREHGESTFGPPESYRRTVKEVASKKYATLCRFQKVAKKNGVRAKLILIEEGTDPAGDIVKTARDLSSGIIAMVSRKEGFDINFLGSVTRAVLRNANLPVWVIHS